MVNKLVVWRLFKVFATEPKILFGWACSWYESTRNGRIDWVGSVVSKMNCTLPSCWLNMIWTWSWRSQSTMFLSMVVWLLMEHQMKSRTINVLSKLILEVKPNVYVKTVENLSAITVWFKLYDVRALKSMKEKVLPLVLTVNKSSFVQLSGLVHPFWSLNWIFGQEIKDVPYQVSGIFKYQKVVMSSLVWQLWKNLRWAFLKKIVEENFKLTEAAHEKRTKTRCA